MEVRGQPVRVSSFLPYVGPEQTQVVPLGGKYLYLLSHLVGLELILESILDLFLFYVCACFAYMYVCQLHVCLVSFEFRRIHCIPWNWNYGSL